MTTISKELKNQVSAKLLLIMAILMGFFIIVIDPYLQQLAPFESWPLLARGMHWAAPWFAVGAVLAASGLLSGRLDQELHAFFNHRTVVIGMIVWTFVILTLVTWTGFRLPLLLLRAGQ